jgi:hypothetical protein
LLPKGYKVKTDKLIKKLIHQQRLGTKICVKVLKSLQIIARYEESEEEKKKIRKYNHVNTSIDQIT